MSQESRTRCPAGAKALILGALSGAAESRALSKPSYETGSMVCTLPRRNKVVLTALSIVAFALVCPAKTQKLSGKMVAYDLTKHESKTATLQQNEEVVVLETDSQKPRNKYVKVVFSSSGTTQIEQKYFEGTLTLEVDVFRDHSCDEKEPRFVPQVSLEQMGGTYLLTDAFKSSPPGKLKTLDCYVAIFKKK